MTKEEKLHQMRHSCSHVLAAAVLEMFPEAKLAIGPAIQDGFYYDFDLPRTLIPEDLPILEQKMQAIVKAGEKFEKYLEPIDKSIAYLKKLKQPYKVEMAEELKVAGEKEISFYRSGEFVDMCVGPHVASTKEIGAFKLTSIAGAYWRGDEKNKMLQRIYGVCFENPKELRAYFTRLEEAKKRDHRRLGKDLDLFSLQDEAGAGLVYWHPKGAMIRYIIESFWKQEHLKNGYEFVNTPHIGKSWLWETSGHLSFYKSSMYSPMKLDQDDYYAKPMNCPFHIMIYKNGRHSYRELPKRWAELGTVYRYEEAGALHGLMRVRGFTQDDAHIICTPEQMEAEIAETLRFSLYMLKSFGFTEFKLFLSTRPKDAVGDPSRWELAQKALLKAIKHSGLEYEVDEGGGAFYGPKIDIKLKDAIGREWQLSTIQFDFNLPERFEMSFIDKDGSEKRPFMIHRALLGSLERFFGVLIEHYAGAFPTWLAPVQAILIPVSEKHAEAADKVLEQLKLANIRTEIDYSAESIGKKIRNAELQKIPYMLVLGDKEIETGEVNVRSFADKSQAAMKLTKFISKVEDEVRKLK